ncbi:YhdH/YhfP family quinone oxidoreductase [Mucilaginibacter terrae]|uniref:YhdH/YhfP family quinone oxidoreductase n=1 Tax=Mucilaginibacter terrae TaxID=1955052 RepID=UPI00362C8E1B
MDPLFNALLVTEKEGEYVKEINQVTVDQLPENDLLIKVSYSSINYKDALSASGNKGVTRKFPHVPGIDASGIIVRSNTNIFSVGDKVLVTGFDLGMNTWGGFGEYISVPAAWVLKLPKKLLLRDAMAFGTAGLTAGLSVYQLINAGLNPDKGEVVVSGATGGVGSIATAILAKLGFNIAAVSGKKDDGYLLGTLGAKRIITREDFIAEYDSKSVSTPTFAAGIDTVGGPTLSGMLKAMKYGATVASCGMVSANELNTSIFPFILRGICLAGIDSVQAPMPLRSQVWNLLATGWRPANLNQMITEITLHDLPAKLNEVLHGQAKGRYVLAYR